MRINANLMAINTHRQLFGSQTAGAKSMEKLSSGFRINRAADDAAGLAISEKMRSQIRGMKQASRNAQDGISVVQTAEGALDEIHAMLQRMKELAVQSANDSNQSFVDREALQLEVNQLVSEINSITNKTEFNKMKLLNGTFSGKHFHVGANANQSIQISIEKMTASGLGLTLNGNVAVSGAPTGHPNAEYRGVNILDRVNANLAMFSIQTAIETLASRRAELGAIQNRIEHTIKNLENSHENLTASEARIRHVDMALEIIENTRANILQQAATAMLGQANQAPQLVLQLLR